MSKLFKLKRRSILGIDINASTLNILEISEIHGELYIEGYGCDQLPQDALNDPQNIDLIADRIKALLIKNQSSTKKVVIAVPDSLVIKRFIQVGAHLKSQELEQFVFSEANKYSSYSVNEINLDFEVLGYSAKQPTMLDILVVLSPTKHINHHLEIIAHAGLETCIVDVRSYAIERTLRYVLSKLIVSNPLVAFIEISMHGMYFFVFDEMQLIFVKEETCGVLNQCHIAEDILLLIKNMLASFYSINYSKIILQIFLVGEWWRQFNLGILNEQLEATVLLLNPLMHMSFGKKIFSDSIHLDAPALTLACGLALRYLE